MSLTKLLRQPQRGALGNGLRVVASAVLVSGGTLTVITRNRRIELRPERDGTTTVVAVKEVKFPVGTRIEISFGSGTAVRRCDIELGQARSVVCCRRDLYRQIFAVVVRRSAILRVVCFQRQRASAQADRATRWRRADEIVTKAGLDRNLRSANVTVKQAKKLLLTARAHTEPVPPARLGAVGAYILPRCAYACAYGEVEFGAEEPKAKIPYVVEAWAKAKDGDTRLLASVNRTPVTGNIWATRDKTKD